MAAEEAIQLKLPTNVVSRYDISRVLRELESLENTISQARIRKEPTNQVMSQLLVSLVNENKLELDKAETREFLKQSLNNLKKSAPLVHISFAVEPDAAVVQKIVLWFRREIDGNLLFQLGVQPSIAAGCVVRTANHYFDFSLRNHLLKNTNLLIDRLKVLQ